MTKSNLRSISGKLAKSQEDKSAETGGNFLSILILWAVLSSFQTFVGSLNISYRIPITGNYHFIDRSWWKATYLSIHHGLLGWFHGWAFWNQNKASHIFVAFKISFCNSFDDLSSLSPKWMT